MPASIVVLASLLVSPSVVPPTGVGFIDLGAGRFATAGTGRSLLVTPEGIDVVLGASSTPRADCGVEAGRASTLAVRWDRPGTAVHGEEARPGAVHLLRGADPARWRRGLAHYSRVRLE